MFIIKDSCFEAYFEAFQTVQLCSQYSFLFQINAHNMSSTYIYHQLPLTCFGVCYTIFRQTTALLAQRLFLDQEMQLSS